MKVKITEPESWKRVLEIEIPKEDVDVVYNRKLSDYTRKLKLPGFRPGKVPLALVKSRFGKGVFAEAVEDLVQENFETACRDNALNPVARGSVSALEGEEGTGISFTIETEVDPVVEIKGYDRLKIKASPGKIRDDDVERSLEELRERYSEFKEVGRAANKGDAVSIEYVRVVIDGIERTDIKNPTAPLELGKGQIREFDTGLAGHGAGETVELSVNFPDDFQNDQLAGKNALFTVRIAKVLEKAVPELSGEFLKKLGDFADVGRLKEQLLADLQRREKERARNEATDKAIDSLIKDNPFEVPPSRVEDFIDRVMEEAARYRRANEPAPVREEIARKYHDAAMRSLKRHRIIEYVAAREKIKATQEEVDREIEKIAAMYNKPFDEVKRTFRQNGTTNKIRADIREQKTLDFLIGEYTPPPENGA